MWRKKKKSVQMKRAHMIRWLSNISMKMKTQTKQGLKKKKKDCGSVSQHLLLSYRQKISSHVKSASFTFPAYCFQLTTLMYWPHMMSRWRLISKNENVSYLNLCFLTEKSLRGKCHLACPHLKKGKFFVWQIEFSGLAKSCTLGLWDKTYFEFLFLREQRQERLQT